MMTSLFNRFAKSAAGLLLIGSVLFFSTAATGQTPHQQIREAVRLLGEQNYAEALSLLRSVESSIANPEEVSGFLALAYLGLGQQKLTDNQFRQARELFQEGRRYNEHEPRLWQGESISLYRQGQYAEMAALLEEATGVVPDHAALYSLLGRAYYAQGQMPEAADSLDKAVQLGAGEGARSLLEKVRREWLVEKEMGREVRGHFHLSFVDSPEADQLARDIMEMLEDAYTELGSELAYYPDVTVPVLLYTKKDFTSITRSPDWAGGVYDGKIRLPLGGVHDMSAPLAAILYHEYMHVLVNFMTNRSVPVWLNEGLAETAGRRLHAPPLVHLHDAINSGRLLDWGNLEGAFTLLPGDDVRLAYEQSYSLVAFMIDNFGWHKMTELLLKLGGKVAWRAAITEVYQDYGLDWPAIRREWQASLGVSQ